MNDTNNLSQPRAARSANRRVESQSPRVNGVWTVYEGGTGILLPYKLADNGEKCVELFPNDGVTK